MLLSRAVYAAAGGKRGGASLAPPTHQAGAAVDALADMSAAIAAVTLSSIAPVGWMCDDTRGKSPKQKATPLRVGKATSWHTPPRVLPTEDTETLDGTGVGGDLPVTVILDPPSWYNHPASATASVSAAGCTVHIYDLGCGQGLCGCHYQRRTSSHTDVHKILEVSRECTTCVPTVFEFINQVLKVDWCLRPRVSLRRRRRHQDAGVQVRRHNPRHAVGETRRGLLFRHDPNSLCPVPVNPVNQREDGLHHQACLPQ